VAGTFQSRFFEALGASPVLLPFARVRQALERGEVDCAVTGTLSGNSLGLFRSAHYVHGMTVSWGVVAHVANTAAWNALAESVRRLILDGVREFTQKAWNSTDFATKQGFYCNVGDARCRAGVKADMILIEPTPADEALRRRILVDVMIPAWAARCGAPCA